MGGAPSTQTVGPGLGAFVAFFFLAVALWLLMRNMNSRMRRMAYQERDRIAGIEAELAAEEAAKGGSGTKRSGTREAPPPASSAGEPSDP